MSDAFMNVLGALTAASSVAMCLSPTPSIYHIYREKKIVDVSILPLVSLWANSHVWTLYALFTDNLFPLFTTYATGECLAIVYSAVYFRYTEDKAYALKAIAAAFSFVLLLSTYAVLGWQGALGQSNHAVGQTIGYVGIVVVVLLYMSPFETLKRVIRTKSASSMPILMCIVGTISNGLWTVYATLDDDPLIAIVNAFCVAFGVTQVVICWIYRPGRAKLDIPTSVEILTPTFE